jgi:hypothetical protein
MKAPAGGLISLFFHKVHSFADRVLSGNYLLRAKLFMLTVPSKRENQWTVVIF